LSVTPRKRGLCQWNSPRSNLFLGLQSPAIHLGWNEWNMTNRVFINGHEVEGNDTPWNAVVADLLITPDERTLVGVSFAITNPQFFESMKLLAKRLDNRVVQYDDRERDTQQRLSPESASVPRFQIFGTRRAASASSWPRSFVGSGFGSPVRDSDTTPARSPPPATVCL